MGHVHVVVGRGQGDLLVEHLGRDGEVKREGPPETASWIFGAGKLLLSH